jgi:hypothetical protein
MPRDSRELGRCAQTTLRRGEIMNKRKKVAWHKHLKKAKKLEEKRKGKL